MNEIEQQQNKIKEYVLANYKKTFIKKSVVRNEKGQIISRRFIDLEPVITIKDTHIEVQNNIDASPIILNKHILQ